MRDAVQACLHLPYQLLQACSCHSTDAVHIVIPGCLQALLHIWPLLFTEGKIRFVVGYHLQASALVSLQVQPMGMLCVTAK